MLADVVLLLARLAAASFAGACLYIALVQQPVRATLGPAPALDDFRATIPRAERLQAPLLMVGLAAGVLALVLAPRWSVAVGVVLLAAVLAQTIATVLPINRRLLSGSRDDHLTEATASLARWGRLHAARTAVAVLGAIALLV